MKTEEMERVEKLGPWYHKIALPGGMVTPGHDWDDLWGNIRRARRDLDYGGKRVLDVGTMDGLWAFEAEQSGATFVVAADMTHVCAERLLFCRERLRSTVYPYFNVRVERLAELRPFIGFFDIVQLLGVLYHLPDPFTALTQCRQMLSEGGCLIIETVAITSIPVSCLIFNGVMPCDHETGYWWRIYQGGAKPQWAPTLSCLLEMLLLAGFIPDTTTLSLLNQPPTHGINSDDPSATYQRARIALAARAAIREEITAEVVRSVLGTASRG